MERIRKAGWSFRRACLAVGWVMWWLLAATELGAQTQTQARLLFAVETVRPGDTVLAGVLLKMAPGWHTYWRNGGDAGAPTTIQWTLPEGVKAGEIQWPVPEKFEAAGLTTYGYHDSVLLMVPLEVPASAPAGPVTVKAKVDWLECEEQCIPGKATLEARLQIGSATQSSTNAPLFAEWQKRLPLPGKQLDARAFWKPSTNAENRLLVIEWAAPKSGAQADFYPYLVENLEMAGQTEVAAQSGKVVLRKPVRKFEGDWPAQIEGLLVEGAKEARAAYAVQLPIQVEGSPAAATAPAGTSALSKPPAESLWVMLGLAFLGGLILNFMPCVLPVIALKILGFVQQSREAPARVRQLGLVYGLGVLFSFMVLAALVIGVQQAGRAASWGMQFQNPQFVIVMTTLVTLVALNLFGVYEVNLGGRVMDAATGAAAREGVSGAFFNGILATALATPCTAPFLAIALGFAFAQPPSIIVLMFAVMALGLASPYVLLSWFPRWLSVLPKPGVWMERFKVAMGFPMLATALWLLTLTSAHFGSRGPLWTGLFLVVVALAAWVYGQFVQRGRQRKGVSLGICAALVVAAYAVALERELNWRTSPAGATASGPVLAEQGGIGWQPWSASAVEQARAAGRPVLVDFTADWCVTCQANKKTSLEINSVRNKLKEINAVALLGDYTREDTAIAAELRRFGRAGVPLVLVYPSDPRQPPIVLPSILTPGIVLNALEQAAKKT